MLIMPEAQCPPLDSVLSSLGLLFGRQGMHLLASGKEGERKLTKH